MHETRIMMDGGSFEIVQPKASEVLQQIMLASGLYPKLLLTPVRAFCRHIPAFPSNSLIVNLDKKLDSVDFITRVGKREAGHLSKEINLSDQITGSLVTVKQPAIAGFQCLFEAPFTRKGTLIYELEQPYNTTDRLNYIITDSIGDPVKERISQKLIKIIDSITSTNARLKAFAWVPNRKSSCLRLFLEKMPIDHVSDFLHQIGWKGNKELLQEIFIKYISERLTCDLIIDLAGDVKKKISVLIKDKVEDLKDQLFSRQQLSPHQYQWLKSWPGNQEINSSLKDSLSLLYNRQAKFIKRNIQRVEFVVTPDRQEIKAHLGYQF